MRNIVNLLRARSRSNLFGTFLACAVASAASGFAQETPKSPAPGASANPYTSDTRSMFGGIQKILLLSAERMPEEHYSFKPVDDVRTYGQIVGHVADSQYAFCSKVIGEKDPRLNIEKTKTSKADLMLALKDAFGYCSRVYDALNDVSGAEMVKFMGNKPKLGVLNVNSIHTIEHYGNLITYMRMKGIVPPTSDPEVMKQLGAKK